MQMTDEQLYRAYRIWTNVRRNYRYDPQAVYEADEKLREIVREADKRNLDFSDEEM